MKDCGHKGTMRETAIFPSTESVEVTNFNYPNRINLPQL